MAFRLAQIRNVLSKQWNPTCHHQLQMLHLLTNKLQTTNIPRKSPIPIAASSAHKLIVNLCAPIGASVNDAISPEQASVQYMMVRRAVLNQPLDFCRNRPKCAGNNLFHHYSWDYSLTSKNQSSSLRWLRYCSKQPWQRSNTQCL